MVSPSSSSPSSSQRKLDNPQSNPPQEPNSTPPASSPSEENDDSNLTGLARTVTFRWEPNPEDEDWNEANNPQGDWSEAVSEVITDEELPRSERKEDEENGIKTSSNDNEIAQALILEELDLLHPGISKAILSSKDYFSPDSLTQHLEEQFPGSSKSFQKLREQHMSGSQSSEKSVKPSKATRTTSGNSTNSKDDKQFNANSLYDDEEEASENSDGPDSAEISDTMSVVSHLFIPGLDLPKKGSEEKKEDEKDKDIQKLQYEAGSLYDNLEREHEENISISLEVPPAVSSQPRVEFSPIHEDFQFDLFLENPQIKNKRPIEKRKRQSKKEAKLNPLSNSERSAPVEKKKRVKKSKNQISLLEKLLELLEVKKKDFSIREFNKQFAELLINKLQDLPLHRRKRVLEILKIKDHNIEDRLKEDEALNDELRKIGDLLFHARATGNRDQVSILDRQYLKKYNALERVRAEIDIALKSLLIRKFNNNISYDNIQGLELSLDITDEDLSELQQKSTDLTSENIARAKDICLDNPELIVHFLQRLYSLKGNPIVKNWVIENVDWIAENSNKSAQCNKNALYLILNLFPLRKLNFSSDSSPLVGEYTINKIIRYAFEIVKKSSDLNDFHFFTVRLLDLDIKELSFHNIKRLLNFSTEFVEKFKGEKSHHKKIQYILINILLVVATIRNEKSSNVVITGLIDEHPLSDLLDLSASGNYNFIQVILNSELPFKKGLIKFDKVNIEDQLNRILAVKYSDFEDFESELHLFLICLSYQDFKERKASENSYYGAEEGTSTEFLTVKDKLKDFIQDENYPLEQRVIAFKAAFAYIGNSDLSDFLLDEFSLVGCQEYSLAQKMTAFLEAFPNLENDEEGSETLMRKFQSFANEQDPLAQRVSAFKRAFPDFNRDNLIEGLITTFDSICSSNEKKRLLPFFNKIAYLIFSKKVCSEEVFFAAYRNLSPEMNLKDLEQACLNFGKIEKHFDAFSTGQVTFHHLLRHMIDFSLKSYETEKDKKYVKLALKFFKILANNYVNWSLFDVRVYRYVHGNDPHNQELAVKEKFSVLAEIIYKDIEHYSSEDLDNLFSQTELLYLLMHNSNLADTLPIHLSDMGIVVDEFHGHYNTKSMWLSREPHWLNKTRPAPTQKDLELRKLIIKISLHMKLSQEQASIMVRVGADFMRGALAESNVSRAMNFYKEFCGMKHAIEFRTFSFATIIDLIKQGINSDTPIEEVASFFQHILRQYEEDKKRHQNIWLQQHMPTKELKAYLAESRNYSPEALPYEGYEMGRKSLKMIFGVRQNTTKTLIDSIPRSDLFWTNDLKLCYFAILEKLAKNEVPVNIKPIFFHCTTIDPIKTSRIIQNLAASPFDENKHLAQQLADLIAWKNSCRCGLIQYLKSNHRKKALEEILNQEVPDVVSANLSELSNKELFDFSFDRTHNLPSDIESLAPIVGGLSYGSQLKLIKYILSPEFLNNSDANLVNGIQQILLSPEIAVLALGGLREQAFQLEMLIQNRNSRLKEHAGARLRNRGILPANLQKIEDEKNRLQGNLSSIYELLNLTGLQGGIQRVPFDQILGNFRNSSLIVQCEIMNTYINFFGAGLNNSRLTPPIMKWISKIDQSLLHVIYESIEDIETNKSKEVRFLICNIYLLEIQKMYIKLKIADQFTIVESLYHFFPGQVNFLFDNIRDWNSNGGFDFYGFLDRHLASKNNSAVEDEQNQRKNCLPEVIESFVKEFYWTTLMLTTRVSFLKWFDNEKGISENKEAIEKKISNLISQAIKNENQAAMLKDWSPGSEFQVRFLVAEAGRFRQEAKQERAQLDIAIAENEALKEKIRDLVGKFEEPNQKYIGRTCFDIFDWRESLQMLTDNIDEWLITGQEGQLTERLDKTFATLTSPDQLINKNKPSSNQNSIIGSLLSSSNRGLQNLGKRFLLKFQQVKEVKSFSDVQDRKDYLEKLVEKADIKHKFGYLLPGYPEKLDISGLNEIVDNLTPELVPAFVDAMVKTLDYLQTTQLMKYDDEIWQEYKAILTKAMSSIASDALKKPIEELNKKSEKRRQIYLAFLLTPFKTAKIVKPFSKLQIEETTKRMTQRSIPTKSNPTLFKLEEDFKRGPSSFSFDNFEFLTQCWVNLKRIYAHINQNNVRTRNKGYEQFKDQSRNELSIVFNNLLSNLPASIQAQALADEHKDEIQEIGSVSIEVITDHDVDDEKSEQNLVAASIQHPQTDVVSKAKPDVKPIQESSSIRQSPSARSALVHKTVKIPKRRIEEIFRLSEATSVNFNLRNRLILISSGHEQSVIRLSFSPIPQMRLFRISNIPIYQLIWERQVYFTRLAKLITFKSKLQEERRDFHLARSLAQTLIVASASGKNETSDFSAEEHFQERLTKFLTHCFYMNMAREREHYVENESVLNESIDGSIRKYHAAMKSIPSEIPVALRYSLEREYYSDFVSTSNKLISTPQGRIVAPREEIAGGIARLNNEIKILKGKILDVDGKFATLKESIGRLDPYLDKEKIKELNLKSEELLGNKQSYLRSLEKAKKHIKALQSSTSKEIQQGLDYLDDLSEKLESMIETVSNTISKLKFDIKTINANNKNLDLNQTEKLSKLTSNLRRLTAERQAYFRSLDKVKEQLRALEASASKRGNLDASYTPLAEFPVLQTTHELLGAFAANLTQTEQDLWKKYLKENPIEEDMFRLFLNMIVHSKTRKLKDTYGFKEVALRNREIMNILTTKHETIPYVLRMRQP